MLLCSKGAVYLGDDKERQLNLAFIDPLLQLLQIITDFLDDIIEWRAREDLVEYIAREKVGTIKWRRLAQLSGGTNFEIIFISYLLRRSLYSFSSSIFFFPSISLSPFPPPPSPLHYPLPSPPHSSPLPPSLTVHSVLPDHTSLCGQCPDL